MCIALLFSETSGSADTDWCRLHENQTCAKCWLVSIMLCYLNLFTGCPNLPAKEPKKIRLLVHDVFFNLDHYLEDLFLRGKFSRILLFCWSSLSLVELLSTIYQRLMDFFYCWIIIMQLCFDETLYFHLPLLLKTIILQESLSFKW